MPPQGYGLYEMVVEDKRLRQVSKREPHLTGDLVLFGRQPTDLEDLTRFLPQFDCARFLVNWRQFPITHVGVVGDDNPQEPDILHASQYDGETAVWGPARFAETRRYAEVLGRLRYAA